MVVHALVGMSDLTRLLTSPTSPPAVIKGLVTGPLSEFGAAAGILMHAVDDRLVMVGAYGYSPGDLAGFDTMPISADLPICQAFREGDIIVTSTSVVEDEYADLDDGTDRWADFRERSPHGSIVSLPLVSQGVPIGCVGFTCVDERDWGPRSLGMLDSLGSILAMWMSHPISGLSPEPSWVASGSIVLTDRQRQMLLLWSTGRTTSEIAAELGYSESTIKQDLRRAVRQFETNDRSTAVERARGLGLLDGSPT